MTVITREALSNSITFVNRFCANRKVITFNIYTFYLFIYIRSSKMNIIIYIYQVICNE